VPCTTSICPNGDYPKQMITQRIYHRDGNNMTFYDRPAGTMTYHPSHGHIHVDNWADFSLRRATSDPDARNWPKIGQGNKQSFCLVNLGDCDSDFGYCVDSAGNPLNKSNIANSDFGTVTGCSLDQGIYVGNLDIYSSGLNGMGIILPSMTCNGDYYIVSITDPENNMLETNDNNNWVTVPITLTQQSAGSFPAEGYSYTVSNTTVNFLATAIGADSLVWHWGDGSPAETTINTGMVHDFPGIGTYIVRLYAYNQCGPTVTIDTVTIMSTVGISSLEPVVSFKAYPNPTKGIFNLTYSLVNSTHVSMELCDALGKSIAELSSADQVAGKYTVQVDPAAYNLHAGIYFVKLNSGNRNHVVRMIVM
ncbi:MAG TPA: T9SS type A sorting domain-containing protein, partial [Bacteroidia bacterium]|nr:T9SS type A sorting domain-containing protein [Bacteroidia bacterium]